MRVRVGEREGRMLARVRREERAAHRGGGRHALATARADVRLRQPFLLRDELLYPYPLRLLLLARGFGCRARLLRLPCLQLALELLVRHARRHPARRGVPHGFGGLGLLRARGLG